MKVTLGLQLLLLVSNMGSLAPGETKGMCLESSFTGRSRQPKWKPPHPKRSWEGGGLGPILRLEVHDTKRLDLHVFLFGVLLPVGDFFYLARKNTTAVWVVLAGVA